MHQRPGKSFLPFLSARFQMKSPLQFKSAVSKEKVFSAVLACTSPREKYFLRFLSACLQEKTSFRRCLSASFLFYLKKSFRRFLNRPARFQGKYPLQFLSSHFQEVFSMVFEFTFPWRRSVLRFACAPCTFKCPLVAPSLIFSPSSVVFLF